MDKQTRRDVDEACLRLMGHKDLRWQDGSGGWWWGPTFGDQIHAPFSPSRQAAFVVPLAEALRAMGWRGRDCAIRWWGTEGYAVVLVHEDGRRVEARANRVEEALALAAARAVGTENDK